VRFALVNMGSSVSRLYVNPSHPLSKNTKLGYLPHGDNGGRDPFATSVLRAGSRGHT